MKNMSHHPGPEGDWAAGRGRQEGRAGVRIVKAGKDKKRPLDRKTLGLTGT